MAMYFMPNTAIPVPVTATTVMSITNENTELLLIWKISAVHFQLLTFSYKV